MFSIKGYFKENKLFKPFKLLINAFRKSWDEICKSVFVLFVITVILASIFYWKESQVQEEYGNWFQNLLWAFCAYIQDPGGIGGSGPQTATGRVIATILGFINILIVAVPAGIIGGGFTSALEEEANKKKKHKNAEEILSQFHRLQDRETKRRYVRPYRTIPALQAKCELSEQDIIDAVQYSSNMRLCDLAVTFPLGSVVPGQLVVETFPSNTPYGNCINRNSDLTIVVTSSMTEPCISWFGWHLAYYGGFNFISKERGKGSFYAKVSDKSPNENKNLQQYFKDIQNLTSEANAKKTPWLIFLLGTSGEETVEHETQLHFIYGNKKGDNSYDNPEVTIKDTASFKEMFNELNEALSEFDVKCDRHEHYGRSQNCITENFKGRTNTLVLRVAWSLVIRNNQRISVLSRIAEILHKHLDPLSPLPEEETLQKKGNEKGYIQYPYGPCGTATSKQTT